MFQKVGKMVTTAGDLGKILLLAHQIDGINSEIGFVSCFLVYEFKGV